LIGGDGPMAGDPAVGPADLYKLGPLGITELLLPDPNDGTTNAPITYEYDTASNLRVLSDQLDHEKEYKYDDLFRMVEEVDAGGDSTLYEYNEQLWRTEVTAETAGDDVITQFVHDDDGRVVTYRAKNSLTGDQETLYTYDAIGRRVTTEWPEFTDVDMAAVAEAMRGHRVVDSRNLLDPARVRAAGLDYWGFGRPGA